MKYTKDNSLGANKAKKQARSHLKQAADISTKWNKYPSVRSRYGEGNTEQSPYPRYGRRTGYSKASVNRVSRDFKHEYATELGNEIRANAHKSVKKTATRKR